MKIFTYNHLTILWQLLLLFLFPSRFFYELFLVVEICLPFSFKIIITVNEILPSWKTQAGKNIRFEKILMKPMLRASFIKNTNILMYL